MWHNPEMQSEQLGYEEKLKAWVEIPSISAEPERRPDIERLADAATATIREFGGTAEKIDPGNPQSWDIRIRSQSSHGDCL
jgi:hypothetical protein